MRCGVNTLSVAELVQLCEYLLVLVQYRQLVWGEEGEGGKRCHKLGREGAG